MNKPTHIIIHCSDSEWGCTREIDKWHKERGFSGVGYHLILLNGHIEPERYIDVMNGSIECGRDLDSDGAHCIGYNERSIGICLILKAKPTIEQLDSLKRLVLELCIKYNIPPENVLGHCETESGKAEHKTCPNFPVEPLRGYLGIRLH